MLATLSFTRTVAGTSQKLDNLSFEQGDYYDIYHHLIRGKGLEEDKERTDKFCGFRIVSIWNGVVVLEKINPSVEGHELKAGDKIELDFEMYGIYTISLLEIKD